MTPPFVFQADAGIVRDYYAHHPNFIIEYDESRPREYCILYFSSHNIYNPNTPEAFEKDIIKKNRFEWYGTRIQKGYKHIFIRDIIKQWYLTGISGQHPSPATLLELLKKETAGYRIIALGSSAGGYAAVVYGQLLNAEKIYSFNGQFQVNYLLQESKETTDPMIFRKQDDPVLRPYYDARNFISHPASIYYFYSSKSDIDVLQKNHIGDLGINIIKMRTSHHGIPFFKSNLPRLLNSDDRQLARMATRSYHPVFFSVKMIGVFNTARTMADIIFSETRRRLKKYAGAS